MWGSVRRYLEAVRKDRSGCIYPKGINHRSSQAERRFAAAWCLFVELGQVIDTS